MRRMRPWIVAILLALAATPAARAAEFCVGATGTACDGGSYQFSASGLTAALTAAKNATAEPDTVRIAEGTLPAVSAFTADDPNGLVIRGAGADATTLSVNAGAGAAITVMSSEVDLSDLRLDGAGATGIKIDEGGLFVGGSQLERLHISGYGRAVSILRSPFFGVGIRESALDLEGNTAGRGILVTGGYGVVTAQRLTIVGRGTGQAGIETAGATGTTAIGSISDSVIDLVGANSRSLRCSAPAGTADLSSVRLAYNQSADYVATGSSCDTPPAPSVIGPGSLGFLNEFGGDLRLSYFSPLIDQGTNAAPTQTLDAAGQPRFVDGDGDGAAQIDLGAYEYQRRAPMPLSITAPASGSTVVPGQAVPFQATATDPDPGDYLTFTWDFGDGTTGSSPAPTHAYTALGTFTATATATDPTGLASTSQIQITVANPPGPPVAAPVAPTPPPPDPFFSATGPRVRVLAAPTASVRRSRSGFSTPTTPDARTATLETAGAVTLRVRLTRLARGRRKTTKGRCRTSHRKGKRCTARIRVKAIGQVPVSPGQVILRFGGRLGKRRLAKGTYEVAVTPVGIDKRRGTPAVYSLRLR